MSAESLRDLATSHGEAALSVDPAVLVAAREAFCSVEAGDIADVEPAVRNALCAADSAGKREAARQALFTLLDRVRRRDFMRNVTPDLVARWVTLVVDIIDRADFTVPELLRSRAGTDPAVVAMRVLGSEAREVTVEELANYAGAIGRGLIDLLDDDPSATIAILAENDIESAICDIACLASGIVNVRVPANAVPAQVEYILRHSRVKLLLFDGEEQLSKVLPVLRHLPDLRHLVAISPVVGVLSGVLPLATLHARGLELDDGRRRARAAAVRSRDLATVMYTSGTTGMPKGIMFSHLNIVSKRFCRGFALRDIGEGDVFLAYLPLYHTFGRWLEIMGTLYWGATYVFARDPSQATLLEDFSTVRPTVYISVPKKWTELYEEAVRRAQGDGPDDVTSHLRQLTGGRLHQGLSAAGHLDPLVFREMHRAGIDLHSGYGMTEGTGGITMTPTGAYRDGSIGCALPGIELRVAEDGELMVRGPYVMMGYFLPPDGESGLDSQEWFATGDIVRQDPDGFLQIVDRKKEIYKNKKGQTIAPQAIENLFRDFDAVSQAFLVGDHRDYNTLLIWPDYAAVPGLRERPPEEVRALLGSLVASSNRFLAPFERVVDFEILDRPLSQDEGELTPKGTFKRQIVEEKWLHLIEPMYQGRALSYPVGTRTLQIPKWVLREIGALRQDVAFENGMLRFGERRLPVAESAGVSEEIRVGDYLYATAGTMLDMGDLISAPALWLGNESLRLFVGEEAFRLMAVRRRERGKGISVRTSNAPPCSPERVSALAAQVASAEVTVYSIHAAAVLLRSGSPDAVAHLERGVARSRTEISTLSRTVLRRGLDASDAATRSLALRALLPHESPADMLTTLRRNLEIGPLADEDIRAFCERGLAEPQTTVLLDALSRQARLGEELVPDTADRSLLLGLLRLLSAYAVVHPVWYAKVRFPVARLSLHPVAEISARAGEELDRMQLGFRSWIGPNLRLAVDVEDAREYVWKDVVTFDENVPTAHRDSLTRALSETSLVRESVFLFRKGVLLSLADILPGGLWISLMGKRHGKAVYRLSIQTRSQGSFDIALNLAEEIPLAELREEIRWLMSSGAEPKLVEDFGSHYAEYGIFTEEFIHGETVERQIANLHRQGAIERLRTHWPFLVWTSFSTHVEFWNRTGRRLALEEPTPAITIAPSHDYQIGSRLVSIAGRTVCETPDELLRRFRDSFVDPLMKAYPEIGSPLPPVVLLAPFIEVFGEERGIPILQGIGDPEFADLVASYTGSLREHGFMPKSVFFAVQRYGRWLARNPQAIVEARAGMLRELWETYGLDAVESRYPETRYRFFHETVFREARAEVAAALERLVRLAREGRVRPEEMGESIAEVRGSFKPDADEDYFLARLAFRHLSPTDDAALISLPSGDRHVTEVVVSLNDAEGGRFRVRGPVSPREPARLLHLFHEANLVVAFSPEHEFLLAIDEKDQVIGGLFYRSLSAEAVHMEKIVVARKQRKKGVSDGLMQEFMRRLKSRGVKSLETGFFRPEYFLRFGFSTEPHYGGLYKDLSG